jgi:hypothetical protein
VLGPASDQSRQRRLSPSHDRTSLTLNIREQGLCCGCGGRRLKRERERLTCRVRPRIAAATLRAGELRFPGGAYREAEDLTQSRREEGELGDLPGRPYWRAGRKWYILEHRFGFDRWRSATKRHKVEHLSHSCLARPTFGAIYEPFTCQRSQPGRPARKPSRCSQYCRGVWVIVKAG